MPKSRAFEELAARIYAEMSPSADVTLDDHVVGRSGQRRQLDVAIRTKAAGVELLVVVETKDFRAPADIGEVEEFASKLEDVQANKGVLVCRSDFTRGAIRSAVRRGIELTNLHDAESLDWRLDIQIPILWVDRRLDVRFDIVADVRTDDQVPEGEEDWTVRAGAAERTVRTLFEEGWNSGTFPRETKHHVVPIPAGHLELRVLEASGRPKWRRVSSLEFAYSVRETVYLGSFSPEQCRGVFRYEPRSFEVSYLPIDALPAERDAEWPVLADARDLAISVRGTVITTEHWRIHPGALRASTRLQAASGATTEDVDRHSHSLGTWQREKLAKRMGRWAGSRRCLVCGAADVRHTRIALYESHGLVQRFGVCANHRGPDAWPPGTVSMIDWLIDHGFGVPVSSLSADDQALLTEQLDADDVEERLVRTWPHGMER